MDKLSSAERLKRCFFHEELDRPAIYLRMYISASDKSYDKLRALAREKTDLKYDSGIGLKIHRFKEIEELHNEDFKKKKLILETPKGRLESIEYVSLKGQPDYTEKYLLETREDAEKYLSFKYPEIKGDTSEYFKFKKEVGDRGIVTAALTENPGGLVAGLFGTERFAMMSVTDRDILHEIMKKRMNFLLDLIKYYKKNDMGPYFWMAGEELITPPIHGPEDFDDFNTRYDKPIIDLVHEIGGRVHIHCHGKIKKVLPGFLRMGADIIHPFEAPPMGDVTAKEAKEIVKDKICIEGNIQIADMYENSVDSIVEQTENLIKDAFSDKKNLIICPTASPYIFGAADNCYKQYKAMVDTVINYAR